MEFIKDIQEFCEPGYETQFQGQPLPANPNNSFTASETVLPFDLSLSKSLEPTFSTTTDGLIPHENQVLEIGRLTKTLEQNRSAGPSICCYEKNEPDNNSLHVYPHPSVPLPQPLNSEADINGFERLNKERNFEAGQHFTYSYDSNVCKIPLPNLGHNQNRIISNNINFQNNQNNTCQPSITSRGCNSSWHDSYYQNISSDSHIVEHPELHTNSLTSEEEVEENNGEGEEDDEIQESRFARYCKMNETNDHQRRHKINPKYLFNDQPQTGIIKHPKNYMFTNTLKSYGNNSNFNGDTQKYMRSNEKEQQHCQKVTKIGLINKKIDETAKQNGRYKVILIRQKQR